MSKGISWFSALHPDILEQSVELPISTSFLIPTLSLSLPLPPTALQPGVGLGLLQELLPSFPV
jgi:hypothetical protein